MKKLEIEALSLDEAKKKAFEQGITVIFDATVWWKICGRPLGEELITFIVNYLQRKQAFENEGAGVIINTVSPFVHKRKYIYTLKKNKKEKIRYIRRVEVRKKSNDEVLAIASNKTEALALAKELMPSIREDIYGKAVYQSNRCEFELNYIPTYDCRNGQYIVFGVEDADVRASKRKRRNYI